jgi:hypothetical protein
MMRCAWGAWEYDGFSCVFSVSAIHCFKCKMADSKLHRLFIACYAFRTRLKIRKQSFCHESGITVKLSLESSRDVV